MKRFLHFLFMMMILHKGIYAQQGKLVKDIIPGSWGGIKPVLYDPRIIPFNGKIAMVADANIVGEEVYIYDPKTNTISLTKEITPGFSSANIYQLKTANNKLFFACREKVNGLELYASDGTEAGTYLLKNINAKGDGVTEYAANYAVANNGLYFMGEDGTNRELWFSDGTVAGTKQVFTGPTPHIGSYPSSLFYHKALDKLFFVGDYPNAGSEPLITDGTLANTKIIKDLRMFPDSRAGNFAAFGNKVVFQATTGFDGNGGFDILELYVSDGTESGTISILKTKLKTFDPKFSNITQFGASNFAFFLKNKIYISDGTAAGTKILNDKLTVDYNDQITPIGNQFLFTANDSIIGSELYISDGTLNGTKLLADINKGPNSTYAFDFTALGNKIYFLTKPRSTIEKYDMWETDGTINGTKKIFAIDSTSSFMGNLILLDKTLYFAGEGSNTGIELWSYSPAQNTATKIIPNFSYKLFPNPTSEFLVLKTELQATSAYITDINGIRILDYPQVNNKMNISHLQAGNYFLNLVLQNNKIISIPWQKIN